jgi:nucleotide-binding universal stress UspA family protein
MGKTILIPVDGSESAFKAVDVASSLVGSNNDRVVLLNVVRQHHPPEELKRYFDSEYDETPTEWEYDRLIASGVLEESENRARSAGVKRTETAVEIGDPEKTIVKTAERERADMIVMGTRGLGKIKGLAFGSVSQKVNHLASCTVITVS